jgi:hypothetical protein
MTGSAMPHRTRLALLAVGALAVALTLVAVRTTPAVARPAELRSELADGPVSTVRESEENVIGSLGMEPANKLATDGGLLANPDLVADGETAAREPASAEQEAAADAQEYADAGEEREGVVPGKAGEGAWDTRDSGRVNFNKAASAEADLDHYFDNLPVKDVTPDHLPKGSREGVKRSGEGASARAGSAAEARFNQEQNSGEEWQDKMNNLEEAIHLYDTKGDAALEAAVQAGLTKQPYVPGELADGELEQQGAIPSGLAGRMVTSTGNKISGIDGLRSVQYRKLVDSIKASISKEKQIMAKLRSDVSAKKAEQEAAGEGGKPAAAVAKYNDKTLDMNPGVPGSYYDEYSNLNPPISGEPQKVPYHGAEGEEPEQAADKAVNLKPSQLGFIGGAGIEGGQGNSDSIYGSHDDHDTYGVQGSGWQGPGNGEAPGDLWNPAKGQRYKGVGGSGAVKGVVAAGESAAAAEKSAVAPEKSLKDVSDMFTGSVTAIADNMKEERRELEEVQAALHKTDAIIVGTLNAGQFTQDKLSEARGDLKEQNDGKSEGRAGAAEAKTGETGNGKASKKGVKQQQLTRIDKVDEPAADLNPNWSPGWIYDEYSNYNPAKSGEPQLVEAGTTNSKVGFKTWKGETSSESPPIRGGRYGDSNAMDSTEMPQGLEFKGTKTAMLKGKTGKKSVRQQQLTRIDKSDEPAEAAMSAIFSTPKQAALAMKNDEIAMNIDQKQLRLGEGQLAAMAIHTLNHHKRELNRVRAGQPEDPAKEEAWDQKNIAMTKLQRKLVDDLSDAVQSEQLQLNAAEDAMVKMEMVSTASLAKQIKARSGKSSSKAQLAHKESKAGGNAGKAAKASSVDGAAAESGPPTTNKLAWVKKLGATALKGLSDRRGKLPSRHDMMAAAHRRRAVGSQQQQLALATAHQLALEVNPAAKEVKKVATKAGGFGLCALFGIACS